MCDDLVVIGDSRIAQQYPIKISFCERCKTAHQMHQIPKRMLFPSSYNYRARHTADVLNGMRGLAERCEEQLGSLTELTVIDVGCNDASLLKIFAEKGAKTIGVEPTDAAIDARESGATIYQDYFTTELAQKLVSVHGQPDIVTFTNVFAHIEDLPGLLQAVGTLMSPTTTVVIENHYLGAVLRKYQFDTFYHEHPRTYSLTSFRHIAASLNARISLAEFPSRYGGNIRIMMQKEGGAMPSFNAELDALEESESDFGKRLVQMGTTIPKWQEFKRAEIAKLVAEHGPLPGKAFPGRAAILIKLLDLDVTEISAVYEKPGSKKVGHYIPGTRIPILSDDEFDNRQTQDAPLLNLAWHISSEISGYLRQRGFKGQIVDIFSDAEFDALD